MDGGSIFQVHSRLYWFCGRDKEHNPVCPEEQGIREVSERVRADIGTYSASQFLDQFLVRQEELGNIFLNFQRHLFPNRVNPRRCPITTPSIASSITISIHTPSGNLGKLKTVFLIFYFFLREIIFYTFPSFPYLYIYF